MAGFNFERLDKLALLNSTEMKVLGGLMIMMSLTLLVPAAYAICFGEDPSIFLVPVIPLLIGGFVLMVLFGPSPNFRTVNGLILVALVWIEMFVIGAIPFLMAGMDPLNSFFESVSCITTTGSSLIADVYSWPESLMVWRSLTQWLGGIAVVIIFIYILPMFGMGRTFFSNELEGSGSSKFSMKLRNAAKSFILVYLGLTITNFILLMIFQAPFTDALCLALTTISTGGLLVSNTSLMEMNIWIQLITMVFMFIGGVNFYLHFKAIYGRKPKVYIENNELRMLGLWFLIVSLVVFVINVIPVIETVGFEIGVIAEEYKDALFTVISLGTTSGFSVRDYTEYSELTMFILIIVMIVGASAGSTSGGIKFGRIRILMRFFSNSLKNVLHPNAVYTVKVDGENVDDSRVLSAVSITLLYLLTTFLALIVLLASGLPWEDAIGLAVGTISNTGSGFGNFGPSGSFESLGSTVKIFLMFLMWVGRLEITLALVFFTPSFWHDVRFAFRSSRKGSRARQN